MIKINKGYIISFIIGIILSSGVTYAATLLARDITYDNTNSNIDADTVQEAIDVLYTKANQTIPDTYKDLSTPVTATSSDILNGKTAYKHDGTILTGSIGTYTGTTIYDPTYETITIPTAGKYLTNDIVINGISSTYKNLTTTTTVTANALLSGIVAYNQSGQTVTGNISTYNVSGHVTPTTSSQTLSTGGKYVNGDIVIDAIPDISFGEAQYSSSVGDRNNNRSTSISLTKGNYIVLYENHNAWNRVPSMMKDPESSSWLDNDNYLTCSNANCTINVLSGYFDNNNASSPQSNYYSSLESFTMAFYVSLSSNANIIAHTSYTDNANYVAEHVRLTVIPINN